MHPRSRAPHLALRVAVERLALLLFTVLFAIQPAFAIRLTCSAVGQLFPARCCCLLAAAVQPGCCSSPSEDEAPVRAVIGFRDCDCAMEFPAAPAATREESSRGGDPVDSVHASAASGARTLVFLDTLRIGAVPGRRGSEPPGKGVGDPGFSTSPPRASLAHGLIGHLAHLRQARC